MNTSYVHDIIKRREEFGACSRIPTGVKDHEHVFRPEQKSMNEIHERFMFMI